MDYKKKLLQQKIYRATDWLSGLPFIIIPTINNDDFLRTGLITGDYVINVDALFPHLINGSAFTFCLAAIGYTIGYFITD